MLRCYIVSSDKLQTHMHFVVNAHVRLCMVFVASTINVFFSNFYGVYVL
jgi:hypothetical protein